MANRNSQTKTFYLRFDICDLRFTIPASKDLVYNSRRSPHNQLPPGSENPLSQDVTNCPSCQRRTPAARGDCIYCGEHLPFAAIQTAPLQRNIDPSEQAFNTVLEPFPGRVNESVFTALAGALQIELSEASALINAGKRVPLARSQTRAEADMITALVRTCGLRAAVIPDEEMRLGQDLVRARRIAVSDDVLRVYHSGGDMTISKAEIRLLVLGELRNVRVDYTEGLTGRRATASNVLDTSEYHSEETLLDVYTAGLDQSFRIKADAFDYSELVSPLSFRSELNFRAALATLRAAVPHAAVDDDFSKMRRIIGRAWPERTRNESRGIKRTLSFRAVAQASVMSNNRDQFDRYSRLMFLSATPKQI